MPTFEYRKLFRANIILKLTYKTINEPIIEGVAYTKNVSSTGLNIIMPHKLDRDTELELQIYFFLDKPAIFTKGKIIWQSECSYIPKSKNKYYTSGILLHYMSSDDAIKASDFVRSVVKKHSDDQVKKIIEMLEE